MLTPSVPYESISVVREDALVTVTLNRPERRNALSDALVLELEHAFTALRDDASTRVVIVTGAPPVFSAGADAGFRRSMTAEERQEAMRSRKTQINRLFDRTTALLEGLEQVTIAAVNGHAIGGGWGIALACDFRVAATEARFWVPEIELGALLGLGSTTRLVRFVGAARAKEIILECRRYSAADAYALGLVHRVVPSPDVMKVAREMAEALLAKPFRALAELKARINMIARTAMPEVNAMTEGFLER